MMCNNFDWSTFWRRCKIKSETKTCYRAGMICMCSQCVCLYRNFLRLTAVSTLFFHHYLLLTVLSSIWTNVNMLLHHPVYIEKQNYAYWKMGRRCLRSLMMDVMVQWVFFFSILTCLIFSKICLCHIWCEKQFFI